MKAIVTDFLGKCRIIDVWKNSVCSVFGGDENGDSDREWGIGAFLHEDDSSFFVLHQNGKASKFDYETETRTNIVTLGEKSSPYHISKFGDQYVGCFKDYIVTFTEKKKISSFETVKGSCASSYNGFAVYGRKDDRTVVYDISSQKETWIASEPPKDELGLSLQDEDRSVLCFSESVFLVGQSEGTVLVYDTRSGNQAACRFSCFPEFPVVSMKHQNETGVLCGDTVGSLLVCDLKMPENLIVSRRGFVGATGGICDIASHSTLPIIAALSCDRTIRIYDHIKPQRTPLKISFSKTKGSTIHLLQGEMPESDDSENEWAALPEDNEGIWDDFVPCPQSKIPNKNIE